MSEIDELANIPTPKAMEGTWTLIAPDGRQWQGDSPMRVCGMEMRERVPAEVGAARIIREALRTPLAELAELGDGEGA